MAALDGNSSDILGVPASWSALAHGSRFKLPLKSQPFQCENGDPLSRSASKAKDTHSSYVISACKKTGDAPLTPSPVGRLTLQRRATRNKESSLLGSELGDTAEQAGGRRLTLQRRAKAESVEQWKRTQSVRREAENVCAPEGARTSVKRANNDPSAFVASSGPSAKDLKDTAVAAAERCREPCPAPSGASDGSSQKHLGSGAPAGPRGQTEVGRVGHLAAKPVQSKSDSRVSGTGSLYHGGIGKHVAKNPNQFGSLDRKTPTKFSAEHNVTAKGSVSQPKSPAASVLTNRTQSLHLKQRPKSPPPEGRRDRAPEETLPPEEERAILNASVEADTCKVENSQVTVAVRVRPFSKREKIEKASQVVFMNGEEIIVEYPDMKQTYTFTYSVSFWSFDECHPRYASQTAVYETLAAPLLERAFEGYNTCLFAYGQTGSGKSYTMMGFSEEPGIIPRFCEDLFAQVAKKQTQEVSYHLEMSFFEVYNEKIHDLLVCKGENGQRKQPVRLKHFFICFNFCLFKCK